MVLLKGGAMAVWRVLRCNPFNPGGYDPVHIGEIISMKTKYLVLIGLLLVLAVVLSGCATGMTASSWPGVTADAKECLYCRWSICLCGQSADRGASLAFSGQGFYSQSFYATPVLTSDGQLIVGGLR